MKKTKALISLLLTAATLFSLTSCSIPDLDTIRQKINGTDDTTYTELTAQDIASRTYNTAFIEDNYPDYYENTVNNLNEKSDMYAEAINSLNEYRQEKGYKTLNLNTNLAVIASIRAEEIAETKRYSHSRPYDLGYFSTLHAEYGWNQGKIGENIAWGYQTVAEAMQALKISTTHNENMLSPTWTCIGIGIAEQKDGTYVLVQEFGQTDMSISQTTV